MNRAVPGGRRDIMEKTNWKQKLTSRKLWIAVAGLIVGILLLFGVNQNMAQQVSGVIMSLGSVVGYIVGEGLVDAASAGTQVTALASSVPAADTADSAAAGMTAGATQAAVIQNDTEESSVQG